MEMQIRWTGSPHGWGNSTEEVAELAEVGFVARFVARLVVSVVAWVAVSAVVQGVRGRRVEWEFWWRVHVLRREAAGVLHGLVKKYGPVLEMKAGWASVLVLSSVAAVEEFCKLHDAEFGGRPNSLGRVSLTESFNSLWFPPLGVYWKHVHLLLDMTTSAQEQASSPSSPTPGIEWALDALRREDKVVDRMCKELEQNGMLQPELELREKDIAKLPYLQAVVKELFRLHPPCAMSFPRESECAQHVLGVEVAPHTKVLINIYSLQRDPVMWGEDAEEFDPDRFTTRHPEVDMQGKHFQLLPFGVGCRRCPGTKLAILHLQLGLANHFRKLVKKWQP